VTPSSSSPAFNLLRREPERTSAQDFINRLLGDVKDMEQETSKRLNIGKTLGRESKGRKAIISLYKMYYVVFSSPFNHKHTNLSLHSARDKTCRK
jgi:hypothetical protein